METVRIPRASLYDAPSNVRILGCRVDRVSLSGAADAIEQWIHSPGERCRFVVATGFHGIWEAHKNIEFRRVLNSADLFCPDGIAPVWLSRLHGEPLPERVPGPDLLKEFVSRADLAGYRSFFLGDTVETLAALKAKLENSHPGHKIAGLYSPPFRRLTPKEDLELIDIINDSKPDVLWVALGLPKQEWWVHEHRERLRVPVVAAVGAAFGFVSGCVRRAPECIGRMGLEWAWRLAMEPAKLWRRDLIDGPRFLTRALLEWATITSTEKE